ncbi:hypothetical protein KW791_02805, partial [Candidatus Parcubacteria bacterium]|nr:hypothetical protein [Candidatus Parcubacteria bacterium]
MIRLLLVGILAGTILIGSILLPVLFHVYLDLTIVMLIALLIAASLSKDQIIWGVFLSLGVELFFGYR